MQFLTTVAAALAASQTVSAQGTALPVNTTAACATPTATSTKIVEHFICRRIVCPRPSRTCSAGEPTRPGAWSPFVVKTVTPSPGACTAVAEAVDNPGCNNCPTCLPAPVPEPAEATALATPTPTA